MYVDEKCQGEVQTPSRLGMIAWIEKNRTADETYCWLRRDECACSQYAKSIGAKFEHDIGVWMKLDRLAQPYPFMNTTETFGNLLARLRAARD